MNDLLRPIWRSSILSCLCAIPQIDAIPLYSLELHIWK